MWVRLIAALRSLTAKLQALVASHFGDAMTLPSARKYRTDGFCATSVKEFQRLEHVTLPTVPTEQAAYYLHRRAQTLRGWACHEDGPLRPLRINRRLAWKVSDLRRLLGVEE